MAINNIFENKSESAGNFTVNAMGVTAEKPAAMIALWDTVVFPHSLASVALDKPNDIAALQYALNSDRQIAVFYQVPEEAGEYAELKQPEFSSASGRCSIIGTLARVVKDIQMPDGSHQVVLRGLKRIVFVLMASRIDDRVSLVRYRAHITSDGEEKLPALLARQDALKAMFLEFAAMHPVIPEELKNSIAASQNKRI
jgi:ATP-dependent Lon protease